MSTAINVVRHAAGDQALRQLVGSLEADADLLELERLEQRLIALDRLDALLCDLDVDELDPGSEHCRAKALKNRLETVNEYLYESVRAEIVFGGESPSLQRWLRRRPCQQEPATRCRGIGFDLRDDILNGVLQLREPARRELDRSTEMTAYQPTPARHILDLADNLARDDIFVDLGSGLGHVPLLLAILTGNRTLGIEVQPAYVATARQCAETLRLSRTQFIEADARTLDLSVGEVFYLFSPFTGSILTDVLKKLRSENADRPIRICSLGPCTRVLAEQNWLKANAPPDSERIAVFTSQ